METQETTLPGVLVVRLQVHGDARGFFVETYRQTRFAAAGIHAVFVQDNLSGSVRNTVRGLHYQLRRPQAKLCRVVEGRVRDVVVDIRRGSPTFGRSAVVDLTADGHETLYIPRGFAHGFAVLSERARFAYKCDSEYDPADEYGIAWNDADLAIDWGVDVPILSTRDRALPRLRDVPPANLPEFTA